MEYFSGILRFLSESFSFANERLFDEDFRLILKYFYFLGFHRPVPSMKSSIYCFIVFAFVPMSHLLGELQNAVMSMKKGNLQKFLISTTYTAFMISTAVQVINFIAKERQIIQLIKAFQTMHESEDEKLIGVYKKKCYKLVKLYSLYLTSAMTTVVVLTLLGYNIFKLATPTLFDGFAEGSLYFPLLFVNIFQVYIVAISTSSSDLLHVLLMIRAGANFELLSEKIRCSTEGDDFVKNEEILVACIKYHHRIIRYVHCARGH